MRFWAITTGLVAVVLAGDSCARAPKLTPYIQPLGIIDRIERSSHIVVGVVNSESTVRRQRRVAASMQVELRRVDIRVEGVIKGHHDGSQLAFLYYRATGAWDGPAPNLLLPGERAIFYLTHEGELFRATNDAYSSHTEVITGRHKVQPATGSEAVRELIARLLLLPGEDMDTGRYVESLYVERAVALDLISESQTVELLRSLLKSSNGQIRGRACILLNRPPLAERDCLPTLIRDTAVLQQDRTQAAELIKKQ